jgi:hypothetical protein
MTAIVLQLQSWPQLAIAAAASAGFFMASQQTLEGYPA